LSGLQKFLETKSAPVTVFDDKLRAFVADMHETMVESGGIGLAANQVGVTTRVITMLIPWSKSRYAEQEEKKEEWHDVKYTFINPVITKKAGKIKYQEGCLSFPEIFDFVDRAAEVWVDAVDEFGKPFQVHANGLFAVCLQHEIDHIDGIVFINRMSKLKSDLIRKKISRKGKLDISEKTAAKA